MEEKKYHFEEHEGEDMVCEPAPAYRSAVAEPVVHSRQNPKRNSISGYSV